MLKLREVPWGMGWEKSTNISSVVKFSLSSHLTIQYVRWNNPLFDKYNGIISIHTNPIKTKSTTEEKKT